MTSITALPVGLCLLLTRRLWSPRGERQANYGSNYIEDDCLRTLTDLRDMLLSDIGMSVGKSTIHQELQGMLYSVKCIRIEKATTNSTTNKIKRKRPWKR
ncbi:Major Facilitator Superfamily (MFS) transporter [Phytophthora megakarya]|uniref:Major Facilitator Superfamily (MFS) transporter n=1 Tax=Phytophthora megakarya TaxID=4795 RepID=A0A225WLA8_9STRA|nr:Major Facilitator Superfamily (MFS) transporter [Phytophthora megakarya]